jgi:hypothetical protein
MHTVQIQLKSRDFRIPGFHLDLKIVYEFQLRTAVYNLVSLPMSHHCSLKPPLLPKSHHCSLKPPLLPTES